MDRKRYTAYKGAIPKSELAVSLGGAWGQLPEGRAWPSYSEADHLFDFGWRDIENVVGSEAMTNRLVIALGVDEGSTDALYAMLDVWVRLPRRACTSGSPGWMTCSLCRGNSRGCPRCTESRGLEKCWICSGLGYDPFRFTLAEYQSTQGKNRTHDNAIGIRDMLVKWDLTKEHYLNGTTVRLPDPSFIDVALGDNMGAGKVTTIYRTELDRLASSEYLGMGPTPEHPKSPRKFKPAQKRVNRAQSYQWGDGLLQRRVNTAKYGERPRHWVHPSAKQLRNSLSSWQVDSAHGGPQGMSHSAAVMVYMTTELYQPKAGVVGW